MNTFSLRKAEIFALFGTLLSAFFLINASVSHAAKESMLQPSLYEWVSCEDSDGGINEYEKGTVEAILRMGSRYRKYSYTDQNETGGIVEYYCAKNAPQKVYIQCETGTVSGVCLPAQPTETLTIVGETLPGDTYVSKGDNKLVWRGMFEAENTTPSADDVGGLIVREIVFNELGTSLDSDIDGCAVYTIKGSTKILQEAGQDIDEGVLRFSSLDDDGISGIFLSFKENIDVEIRCDIASTLSGEATFQLGLDVSEVAVENEDGNDATVTNTTDINGATYFLVSNGTLEATLKESRTPDTTILVANGGERHETAAFVFEAADEDMSAEELTLFIAEVDTTALLGTDIANDVNAIDRVSLYYEDGTPVLKTNGTEAETSAVSGGEALFRNLDLLFPKDEEVILFARVALNEISDIDVARSGMTFAIAADLSEGKSEIRGNDSGNELTDDDIFVDNESNDRTDDGENMYVFRNNLVAEKRSSSTFLSAGPQKELLKFNLTKADASSEAFLQKVVAETEGTVALTNVTLRNNSNEIIASDGNSGGSGIFYLEAGMSEDAGPAVNTAHLVTFHSKQYDEVDGGAETYTIRGDISGITGDDTLTVVIRINSSTPGTDDGITWKDAGTNGGNDGVDIQWIDLAEDTSTQFIVNILTN